MTVEIDSMKGTQAWNNFMQTTSTQLLTRVSN